jgi:RHS repeat-associated protein
LADSCAGSSSWARRDSHVDHLNTPRLIADANQNVMWRWDQGEPFGDSPPDENPSGLGVFTQPLRFGGWQYADNETGEFWNWMRTYSRTTGRFDQFDPTGLQHGINGFVYANLDPLRFIDRDGRAASGPNQDPAAACKYYDQVCSRTSGKCFYYCNTAPNICRYPYASPFLWGVPSEKVNCIRTCLIREDQGAWGNPQNLTKSCPACVKDSVIDDYHNKCYTACGVSPSRYPGVRPGGIPLGNE